jgi:hypothetical protein
VAGLIDRRVPILVAVALGSAAVMASGGSSSSGGSSLGSGSSAHPATADVPITKCGLPSNPFEGPHATVKVTNHSSKESDYSITVAFNSTDGSKQYDTGDALITNLGSGQTSSTGADSLKSGLRKKKFVCKVVDVERTASN